MDGPARCLLEICEFWCLWKIIISSRCRYESRYNHQNIWVGYRCILSWTIIIFVYICELFYSNSRYTVILENCSMVHLTFENMEMKIRKVESADVSPPPWLRPWIKENVLLKNPTKSGIKAVKWILLGAQLLWVCWHFPATKVGRHDNLDVIWICILFLLNHDIHT